MKKTKRINYKLIVSSSIIFAIILFLAIIETTTRGEYMTCPSQDYLLIHIYIFIINVLLIGIPTVFLLCGIFNLLKSKLSSKSKNSIKLNKILLYIFLPSILLFIFLIVFKIMVSISKILPEGIPLCISSERTY